MPPFHLAPRTLGLIGGGVAALLLAGVIWLVADPLGPGSDELPSSIGDSEREDIAETLEGFFFGVDQYNPQVAGESMLTPGEVGIEEFARMVFELAAVQSAGLAFSYNSVGAVELDEAAGVVRAVAVTDLKNVEVELVRRDGQWQVAEVPDLSIPEDRAPYRYEWEVTNTYPAEDGGGLVVVGELSNTGDSPWVVLGLPGVLLAPDGAVIRAESPGITTRPFVDPGQVYPFRVDLTLPEGLEGVDPQAFRPIPNVRVAHPSDRSVLATSLTVDPEEREPTTETYEVTVTNGESEPRTARVIALVQAADGRLLDLRGSDSATVPGGGAQPFELGGMAEPVSESAAVIQLETWGTVTRS